MPLSSSSPIRIPFGSQHNRQLSSSTTNLSSCFSFSSSDDEPSNSLLSSCTNKKASWKKRSTISISSSTSSSIPIHATIINCFEEQQNDQQQVRSDENGNLIQKRITNDASNNVRSTCPSVSTSVNHQQMSGSLTGDSHVNSKISSRSGFIEIFRPTIEHQEFDSIFCNDKDCNRLTDVNESSFWVLKRASPISEYEDEDEEYYEGEQDEYQLVHDHSIDEVVPSTQKNSTLVFDSDNFNSMVSVIEKQPILEVHEKNSTSSVQHLSSPPSNSVVGSLDTRGKIRDTISLQKTPLDLLQPVIVDDGIAIRRNLRSSSSSSKNRLALDWRDCIYSASMDDTFSKSNDFDISTAHCNVIMASNSGPNIHNIRPSNGLNGGILRFR